MMNKTLWPGNFNSTTFMMNKTHLVVKGTPKFDVQTSYNFKLERHRPKGTDLNSNLKKPNQSEVQNLKVRPRVATSYN